LSKGDNALSCAADNVAPVLLRFLSLPGLPDSYRDSMTKSPVQTAGDLKKKNPF
jgi:hypothetical protein